MSNINKFSTSNIDFDKIREDLKNFLKGQSEFTDYNFEGSGLSNLLNVLAYNTHYNLVYDNFAINEAFLDTALKKSSVISHANLLNYVPRSNRCPIATVNITVVDETQTSEGILKIPAFSKFNAKVDGENYTFYTITDYTAEKDDYSTFLFEDVKLYEGSVGTAGGTFTGDNFQNFRLEDAGIDTTTIKVLVDEQTSGENTFTLSTKLNNLDGSSKVYFLKQNPDETYQIDFGNGQLGQSLKYGDIVSITYLTTNGEVCNGVKSFEYADTVASDYDVSVVCTSAAAGGSYAEDIESIRINAPRMYSTQNRCVTENDYKTIIKAEFPTTKAINVWGGDSVNPPEYGKVFISIIKNDGTLLTEDEKETILKEIVNPRKVLTSIVEFKDPKYIKIAVTSTIYYDSQKTNLNESDLVSNTKSTITSFINNNLGSFDQSLKFSQLTTAIDETDESITNNDTTIKLVYEIDPSYGYEENYSIDFGNKLRKSKVSEENIISTCFKCSNVADEYCYIDDDPETNSLRIFHLGSNGEKIIDTTIGTIDYETGKLEISGLSISEILTKKFEIKVNPYSNDVSNALNQFSIIDTDRLIVKIKENM